MEVDNVFKSVIIVEVHAMLYHVELQSCWLMSYHIELLCRVFGFLKSSSEYCLLSSFELELDNLGSTCY